MLASQREVTTHTTGFVPSQWDAKSGNTFAYDAGHNSLVDVY